MSVRSGTMIWGSRALSSCGLMVVLSAFAGNTASSIFDLPMSPSVVHADSHTAPSLPAPSLPPVFRPATIIKPTHALRINPLVHLKSGMASWYGKVFQDHATASGKRFDKLELTAAHRDLPFGSRVRVTDLRNHKSVIVTITDRGVLTPARVIDLSYAAAEQLGMIQAGVAPVSLELLAARDPAGAARELVASLR